jgi:hypothetical protein
MRADRYVTADVYLDPAPVLLRSDGSRAELEVVPRDQGMESLAMIYRAPAHSCRTSQSWGW